MIPDVFLISPVRELDSDTEEKIRAYVESLEQQGKKVYWSFRDTDQVDPVGNRICCDNFTKIIQAAEIHVWYDAESLGSIFDFGGAYMLLVLRSSKKVILANREAVEQDAIFGKNSFADVLLAVANGAEVSVQTLEDARKAH